MMTLEGRIPDWNLRVTVGLVVNEAATLGEQASGILNEGVADGFHWDAIEQGQWTFR